MVQRGMVFAVAALVGGCGGRLEGDAALVQSLASEANDVAGRIGGAGGYGGPAMVGYYVHAPMMMGFLDFEDLADADAALTIILRNESAEEATFHLSYLASYLGPDDQSEAVVVAAGQEVEIEIPCSEIVGMGPLSMPGDVGCHLAGRVEIENTTAVPLFLGMDFACDEDETRKFVLTPDGGDLDDDGDVEELVLLSDGLFDHRQLGGPFGHSHRGGDRGPHMMMGDFEQRSDEERALSGSGWGMMGRR